MASSDTSSVIDTEGKETGYDTPDEVLDDQQSEIGWSRSDMHSTLGELPPVSIWANAAEDLHDGVVADPCAWQQGWMVPGVMQFPMQFPAPAPDAGGQLYAPSEEDVPADCGGMVTAMMRNLPKKLTQHGLLEEINSKGFAGTYDFVYLPMDVESKVNRGYAFINFMDPAYAAAFKSCYEGRQLGQFNARKVIAILPAVLQGYEANREHFATSRVAREDPGARPLFLRGPAEPAQAQAPAPHRARERRREGRRGAEGAAPQAAASAPPANKDSAQQGDFVLNFCPFCGGSVGKDFKFCQYCGKSLQL